MHVSTKVLSNCIIFRWVCRTRLYHKFDMNTVMKFTCHKTCECHKTSSQIKSYSFMKKNFEFVTFYPRDLKYGHVWATRGFTRDSSHDTFSISHILSSHLDKPISFISLVLNVNSSLVKSKKADYNTGGIAKHNFVKFVKTKVEE